VRLRLLFLIVLCVSLVGCDHATKELAYSSFREDPEKLWAGALTLTYTENRDMAFGLLSPLLGVEARLWVLSILKAAALSFGIGYLLVRFRKGTWGELLAVTLLVAGAAGNLLDRVTRGYVVDFLHIPHWPVFNVADIVVCMGYGFALLEFSRRNRERATLNLG
jgi:signal peptidase II